MDPPAALSARGADPADSQTGSATSPNGQAVGGGAHPTRGAALILASALMFGSYGLWSRLLGPHFANFFQCWTRSLLVTLLLLPFVIGRKALRRIEKPDRGWFLVFMIFTAATQAPIYYAFNHMDIGTATLLFYVTSLLTMYVVGVAFLGEKLERAKVASFVLACVGMYVLFSFSLARFAPLAAVMAVVNGVASGGELAFSKKLSGRYPALSLVLWSWVAVAVTSLALSLALGEPQVAPSLIAPWFWLLGFAIASLFGFWLVIAGLAQVDASLGGLLGLLEIVFGVGFGIAFFHERLGARVALGGGLIVLAAALPPLADLGRSRPGRLNPKSTNS